MKHRYTEEQLRAVIETSYSVRHVLQQLGIAAQGGNYKVIYKFAKEYNISLDHFTGKVWSKGKTLTPRRDIQDYLSNKFPCNSGRLKKRLISEGFFTDQCSSCQLSKWLGNPIPLELDHVDGNSDDNSLSNLRLLCPNCHALTPTYRGKNQKRCK